MSPPITLTTSSTTHSHATGLAGAKDAVRAGAQLLVHSVTSDPVDDEFLSLARAAGTYYTPTLTVYDGYRQIAERKVARETQPFACVDPATRAKALATDSVAQDQPPDAERLASLAEGARRAGRRVLLEHEGYALLEAAGVSCPRRVFVRSSDEVASTTEIPPAIVERNARSDEETGWSPPGAA